MSKILLLGATGLIGSSVYRWLENTYQITRLGRSSECELKGDLSKPESMDSLVLDDFDALVHCAGVTDEDFRSRPADAFVQSSVGLNRLVQKAIATKIKRFIYISTSHVYGRQAGTINESSAPDPLSDYAIAHYAAEQTLKRNSSSFDRVKDDLLAFLVEQKRNGKSVVAYGAAAKGNTLLNYCGVKKDLIDFVVDASPHKQGLFLPGSNIPIVDESRLKLTRPDYIVILPWNLKDEIADQLHYVKEWGPQFVTGIPDLKIFQYET